MKDHSRAGSGRRGAAGACLGVVAALTLAGSAGAAVKDDRAIEVAHGRDLVIMNGYPRSSELLVEVVRDGVTIATTAEQRYKTDRDGFLEVNHVGATDCFDGGTAPDIRPGDAIRTTVVGAASPDVDTMVVQNVAYDGAPVERAGTGVYEVRGTALQADGTTPLPGAIELRLNHPDRGSWDATGRRDWRVTAEADAAGRYVAEFDTGGSADDAAAIGSAEMAALWLGPDSEEPTNELTSYDGPGSPCNPAPGAGITHVSHDVVNLETEHVTLHGYAPAGAAVSVGGEPVLVSEAGGWSHSVPVTDLPDGPHTLTAVIDGVAVSRTIQVDRTAPAAPTASRPGGEIAMPQTIHLSGEDVRYSTDGSAPTRGSLRYAGGIGVTHPLTIKAISVDAAGNVSPVATFAYTEQPVAREVPQPVVVERPVPVVTEVVRVVAAPPAVAAGIDGVTGPRRVRLAAARKGVRLLVTTRAGALSLAASRGGRLSATRRTAKGYTLVFKAKRRGTYELTVAAPDGAARTITVKVR